MPVRASAAAAVAVDVPWLGVQPLGNDTLPAEAGVSVIFETSDGSRRWAFLPITSATMVAHGRTDPLRASTGFHLRDNRWYQGLLRLDLQSLPADAQIVSATFHAMLGWVERRGYPATFRCYRMRVPWSVDLASWSDSGIEPRVPWNGLRPGIDFEAASFTALDVNVLDETLPGGSELTIPGFASVMGGWLREPGANHGFLLTFDGPALECSVGLAGLPERPSPLGPGGEILLLPNLPLLQRVVSPGPDDVEKAFLVFSATSAASVQLSVNDVRLRGGDVDRSAPIRTVGTLTLNAGTVSLAAGNGMEVTDLVRGWLGDASGASQSGLLLRVEEGGPTVMALEAAHQPRLHLLLRTAPAAAIFPAPPAIHPDTYVTIREGHLNYAGNRLRLWGVVGQPSVARLVKMGFNAERVWEPRAQDSSTPGSLYSAASAREGSFAPVVPGDGSVLDRADRHMFELKEKGLFVMLTALADTMPLSAIVLDDSFVADESDDWRAWQSAMRLNSGDAQRYIYVDERLQRARKQHARNLLTHVNPYTGKAYGAEEHVAIYEIFNENGFVFGVLAGEVERWPEYFRGKLASRWNEWLGAQYGSSEHLRGAWGALAENESLEQGNIALAPLASARSNYPEARGRDFVRFLVELVDAFHQDFRSFCRALFPSGVGVNVVPFSFDTLYWPSLSWSYVQSLGDVNSFGMYFWDLQSVLQRPPSAYVLDTFTISGMPAVIYETNHGRPGRHRAEYPFQLATLACWQDWDAVFWHYWGPEGGADDIDYLTGTLMPPTTDHYWNAVHHELDPVMGSALAMAGRIFLEARIPPAANPAVIDVPSNALFAPWSAPPGGIADLTFKRGSRLSFHAGETGATNLEGAPLPSPGQVTGAVATGPHITWDWPNARLLVDAPAAKVYVGNTAEVWQFSDGVTLDRFTSPWIAFGLLSADNAPIGALAGSRRFWATGVFDAQNSGFDFDFSVSGGPVEQALAVRNRGRAPILVTPVGFRVRFAREIASGERLDFDFAFRPFRSESLSPGSGMTQTGPTPLMSVADVFDWGAERMPDLPRSPGDPSQLSLGGVLVGTVPGTGGGASFDGSWMVAGMSWGWNEPTTLAFFQSGQVSHASLRADFNPATGANELIVTGAQLAAAWGSRADLVFSFRDGRQTRLEARLLTPPPLRDLLASLQPQLGEPVEAVFQGQAGNSRLRWEGGEALPNVLITESQGTTTVIVSLE